MTLSTMMLSIMGLFATSSTTVFSAIMVNVAFCIVMLSGVMPNSRLMAWEKKKTPFPTLISGAYTA
jgi:hypothetical protein